MKFGNLVLSLRWVLTNSCFRYLEIFVENPFQKISVTFGKIILTRIYQFFLYGFYKTPWKLIFRNMHTVVASKESEQVEAMQFQLVTLKRGIISP